MKQDFRFFPVTGFPRSGTSLLHSLLCTSPQVNPYVKECSWLTKLIHAYKYGLDTFSVHTSSFFPTPGEFLDYNRGLIAGVLADIWKRLGAQPCLALKDPDLVFILPEALNLVPGATATLIARDVRDVVASQLVRMRKQHQDPEWYDTAFLEAQAESFQAVHRRLAASAATLGDRVVCVRYETLVQDPETVLTRLEGLLDLPGMDADKAWKRANFDITSFQNNEAFSNLYGQRISSANIGRHAGVLREEDSARLERHNRVVDELFRVFPRSVA